MSKILPARCPLAGLLLLILAPILFAVPLARAEGEEKKPELINIDQARDLSVNLLRLHLTQHSMDHAFMKRMLKEYVKRLDPSRTIYNQEEVDAMLKKTPEELADISLSIKEGNLKYFSDWIAEYKAKFLLRDDEFFKGLKDRKADVMKKITREEIEANKDDHHPKSDEERRNRLLLLARSNFEFYRTYQPEEDAFELALKTLERLREKKLKLDPEVDTAREVMKAFMSALDPHSEYMDAEETEEFRNSMARSFSGIGVQIRACLAGAQIVEVIKNFPAWKNGEFEADDQIIAVDDFVLSGLPLDQVVKRIKGPKGTEVKITLRKGLKDGEKEQRIVNVKIVRDTIELADIRVMGKTFDTEAGRVGYVAVENFYEGVSGDVKDRIKGMEKEKPLAGLILDLRNNGGGYLEEAIRLGGLFIGSGPIVAERDSAKKKPQWRNDPDLETVYDGPLVVLVNQFSASASEIVAGSLKDYGRAVVVGPTQTHGKGTVQKIIDLGLVKMPGAIRITVQQYFLAGGDSVQLNGVQPDILIPGSKLREDWLERAQDGAIPYARVDSGIPADHPDFAQFSPLKQRHLARLAEISKQRVAENKAFDAFRKLDAEGTGLKPGEKPDPKPGEKPDDGKTVAQGATPEGKKDRNKDLPDPQRDEAVQIVADMVRLWSGQDIARKESSKEPEPAVK